MKYLSWGMDNMTPPGIGTSFKYTGQREAEAGLYFYNARYYDPGLGHFIQADTIIPEPGNPLAWDRYAYANNNPLYYTDPSGHSATVGEGGYDDEHKNQAEEDAQRNRQLYCQAGNTLYCSYAQNHPVDTAVSITVGMIGAGAAAAVLTPAGTATAGIVAAGTTTLGATTYTTVAGYGASAGTALETANLACGGDMCADEINTGVNTVYRVMQNGNVIYVGISQNWLQRSSYWFNTMGWRAEPINGLFNNLSRADARAVEQVLINLYKLPNLNNVINSIATSNPIYNSANIRGNYLLNLINYYGK
jgi:RHS repeat-associated protein